MRRRRAPSRHRPTGTLRCAAAAALVVALGGCGSGPGPTDRDPEPPVNTPASCSADPVTTRPGIGPSAVVEVAPTPAGPAPAAPDPGRSTTTSPAARPVDAAGPQAPTATTGFAATITTVDDALAVRMRSSWRPGCPVALADLRYLALTYRGPDGADHVGELVVAAAVADHVVAVFRQVYEAGFPITSMRLVDDFGGHDGASMAADNTSAFNCRPVTGGGGFSEHSYGTAVDLNPVQNPYVRGETVLPPAGREFRTRPDRPGVLHAGDPVVAAFAAIGWAWGGAWSSPTDYQHFSLGGR